MRREIKAHDSEGLELLSAPVLWRIFDPLHRREECTFDIDRTRDWAYDLVEAGNMFIASLRLLTLILSFAKLLLLTVSLLNSPSCTSPSQPEFDQPQVRRRADSIIKEDHHLDAEYPALTHETRYVDEMPTDATQCLDENNIDNIAIRMIERWQRK